MSELSPYHSKPAGQGWGVGLLDDFFRSPWYAGRMMAETFRLDVREDSRQYTIEADLPGIKKEDIELFFDGGRLTIAVESGAEAERNIEGYVHRERRTDCMQRSVQLADAAAEGVQARLENGVLTVTVPRQQKQENRKKIQIQ